MADNTTKFDPSNLKLVRSTITIGHSDGEIVFEVVHNLKSFGIDIDDALVNWLHRTKKFTAKSFCKYVMSKDESFVCMDSEHFERFSKIVSINYDIL